MAAVDPIDGFALFDRLSPGQRAVIAQTAEVVDIPPGARLFDEGQPATGCWLIRTGDIALETAVPGRGRVVVQTLGPGDVLGWSWLVPPHHWHFTALTTSAVSALRLDTDRLSEIAQQDPALGYPLALGLFETLLARLQATRARLLDLYGSPRER